MRRIAILGSTGSIGRSTLDVVESYPERFQIVALAAGTNIDAAFDQARRAVRMRRRVLKIRADPVTQRDRLTDVENPAVAAQHEIHAGRIGKLSEGVVEAAGVGRRAGRRHALAASRRALRRSATARPGIAEDRKPDDRGDGRHDSHEREFVNFRCDLIEMLSKDTTDPNESKTENRRTGRSVCEKVAFRHPRDARAGCGPAPRSPRRRRSDR